ncbi:unnamed protein product [Nesidiocoris tenuis]|uniref:Laminin subunit alpha n=1 Tax=Nesidiocoris tenuis TaxID=355587 RepID=A0A6H5GBC4_9HEMI|nr:unnamed protein product [Nesidiocoris tenuis]
MPPRLGDGQRAPTGAGRSARIFAFLAAAAQIFAITCGEVLTPPYFNIAERRRAEASYTCGEGVQEPELYCKLVGAMQDYRDSDKRVISGQICDYCDPTRPDKSHPPSYAVDGAETYWISPPLSRGNEYNQVNFTIYLGQEFHVAYIIIKMGISPRPGLWVLERSADNGLTYKPWQYFAETPSECEHHFGAESLQEISRDDSVICTTMFSKTLPFEHGEILVSLLNDRPSAEDFFNSTVLQEWTRATNVRLRFLRTQTLLGHLMSVERGDATVTRRYFYSIKDISIGGRCRCNGHADVCIPKEDNQYFLKCLCQHNTCGDNCDVCCENKVQKKWRQSKTNELFLCEECNCNKHSETCVYNETIDNLHLSMDIHGKFEGGGECKNCRDNTEGINCEKCVAGFYRPWSKNISEKDACVPCNCTGIEFTGNCEEGSGKCECKHNYDKPDCDACAFGFTDFPECVPCKCDVMGTQGSICDPIQNVCPCKPEFSGDRCDQCDDGYFNFPNCTYCDCNPVGSQQDTCDKMTGECECKDNFAPSKCNVCANGYYKFPECLACSCDHRGTKDSICNKETGTCLCKEGFGGPRCDQCLPGFKDFPNCVPCNCSDVGSSSHSCDLSGKCACYERYSGKQCDQCSPGYYNYPDCLECGCKPEGSYGKSCNEQGDCNCRPEFEGKLCDQCKEGYYNYPLCEQCDCVPAGVTKNFSGCGSQIAKGLLCDCKPRVTGRRCSECKPLYWNLQEYSPEGCIDCDCYTPGVIGGIAECDDKNSGQCYCKRSVVSRECKECADGSYDLQESNIFGCTDCGCDIGGALDSICNKTTGACKCKNRIEGRTCNKPLEQHYFPTLHQLSFEVEDGVTPENHPVRYGFSESEFPGFSWKGYAFFSRFQDSIKLDIEIEHAALYRILVRYVNLLDEPVVGRIILRPISDLETKLDVLFPPSREPNFVTVSGLAGGVPSPFIVSESSGKQWELIMNVDQYLLVDYIVLLPSSYFEGNILVEDVKTPCTRENARLSRGLCLMFAYPMISQFQPSYTEQAYGENPNEPLLEFYQEDFGNLDTMAKLNARQPILRYDLSPPKRERFVIVVNYYSPADTNDTVPVLVELNDYNHIERGKVHLTPCRYAWVCRQVVLDSSGRFGYFNNTSDKSTVTLQLDPDRIDPIQDVAIESIAAIPFDSWSSGYVKPSPTCVMIDGTCQVATYPPSLDLKKSMPDKRLWLDYVLVAPESKFKEVLMSEGPVSNVDRYREECGRDHFHIDPNTTSEFCRNSIFTVTTQFNNGALQCSCNPAGSTSLHCNKFGGQCECKNNVIGRRCDECKTGTYDFPNCKPCDCPNYAYCDIYTGERVRGPDIILSGAGLNLLHYSLQLPQANVPTDLSIKLSNLNFQFFNGLTVSREQFMQVLQDLEAIYIRATYWEKSVTTSISNIKMDTASDNYTGMGLALSVEECFCPPGYTGLSCEECSDGYYRSTTGSFGGFCVPCQCNGHADTCDKVTGVCKNCQHGTIGAHCEKCSEGYYGNAMDGTPDDCLICPCPLPITGNNFATSCEFSPDGQKKSCECKPGYYGDRCEVCAAGFFGSPETIGSTCQPCNCSGNIDIHINGSCDSVTGRCDNCLYNTAGPVCNFCKPWFFGDAVNLKNCQSCACEKCGTSRCDHATGTCECKPNVEGEKCDRCVGNYFGYDSCQGCKPCNCKEASLSSQCDDKDGKCRCKPGVTGTTCDRCAEGFWNYTSEGCTVCSCNEGYSEGVGCDPVTGTCHCLTGVIGEKCDHCPHRWVLVKSEGGCFECDKCTHDLLNRTDEIHAILQPTMDEFEGDFIALELDNWQLRLTIDLGDGPTSIISDKKIGGNHWYQAIIERLMTTYSDSLASIIAASMFCRIGKYPKSQQRGPKILLAEMFSSFPQILIALLPYRTGKSLRLTVNEESQNKSTISYIKEGLVKGQATVLNIDRSSSKLFVGGVSPEFNRPPAVRNEWYKGRISDVVVGDSVVGLWNFEDQENIKPANIRQELEKPVVSTGCRFNGDGWVALEAKPYMKAMERKSQVLLDFKTFAKEGLLFLSHNSSTYLSIEIREGRIIFQTTLMKTIDCLLPVFQQFDLGSGGVYIITPTPFNDGEWHHIEISRLDRRGRLKVDGVDYGEETAPGDNNKLMIPSRFYFGGYPGEHELLQVTNIDFDGCIDQVKFDSAADLNQYSEAFGVKPGCPEKVASVVSFEEGAHGYVLWPNVSQSDNKAMELILRFKTTSTDGLIAYALFDQSSISLRLEEGQLVVYHGSSRLLNTQALNPYNDTEWHVVLVTYDESALKLIVDDSGTYNLSNPPKIRMLHGSLYFGGVPSVIDAEAAIAPKYSGCVSDATLNGVIINFGNLTEIPNAIIGKCVLHPKTLVKPPLRPKCTETPSKTSKIERDDSKECALPLYPAIDANAIESGERLGKMRFI